MGDSGKSSLRIDWFDGTLIEDSRQTTPGTSAFDDEDAPEPAEAPKAQPFERKLMGFKRLLDLSHLNHRMLTLQLTSRSSFWYLLDEELKGDFIVLIVRILTKLYSSLEPGEKSVIATSLNTRFIKSNFMETLKTYVSGLAKVRIHEKRMNSQLWDDVEIFYFDIINMCEGIINFGGCSGEFLNNIQNLLELTKISIIEVKEEHNERFSETLFEQIDVLKARVTSLIDNATATLAKKKTTQVPKDPNHYKNLSIFPNKDDLLGKTKIDLKPNIINGAYKNVEEYLDLQFKLLREDYFAPLREGLYKYMENPSKRRHENIRVYPKVRIIRTYIANNQVGHIVDLAWWARSTQGDVDSKKYAYNKQLMFGSLLLFTSDNFDTILCATVLDSNLNLLNEGYLAVSFHNPVSNKIYSEAYLMVESEVFFEPYHRVLKVLQEADNDDLPMRRYIVDVQKETRPPAYLTEKSRYSVATTKSKELTFPVLNQAEWPTKSSLNLDDSQMEAYKLALTKEFAVIQGPPGTGKTYIGIKIASTLLKNLSLEGTPMLIICYTNHALDQFLEGILDVTKNIVRLGSQSKNKKLEPYLLNNVRGRQKSKYSYLYASKRSDLESIYNKMAVVQGYLEKCDNGIVCYKHLKPYLHNELTSSTEDPILDWLFEHLNVEKKVQNEEAHDSWENNFEELGVDDNIETCFSENKAMEDIESLKNNMNHVNNVTDCEEKRTDMLNKLNAGILKIENRLDFFKKQISTYRNRTIKEKSTVEESRIQKENLYKMTSEERWNTYFQALDGVKECLLSKMNEYVEQHKQCSQELEEISCIIDTEVMKTTRVVGVTTAAAARRHLLMKSLLSPIVIVEEAAEVLETHIVASLTDRCQHLILIGDHKQLRPSTAHYKLAQEFNLAVSLFERVIRNGVHSRTLTSQRRMRPAAAALLVPTLYRDLHSHPLVYNYPDVRGLRDNMYFLTHDVYEDSEGMEDSWSHRNTHEAWWCVSLAEYLLRRRQYTARDVTILATYTGQAACIKELSKKYELLKNVKMTVVDNYQGEENRIVILSLVRSNRDGKIGFLAAENRICVALSRSKEGMYIFGNMNILKSSSKLWRSIDEKLRATNAIGKQLALTCYDHKDNVIMIDKPEDFQKYSTGSCICRK